MLYLYGIIKKPRIMQNEEVLQSHIIPHDKALEFFLGGNALFTIKSKDTGVRFTYKIIRKKDDENYFKILAMVGSDNTRDYRQMGFIQKNVSPFITPVSDWWRQQKQFVALNHVYSNLTLGMTMKTLEIWHEGRCCKCGRVLTVPESIERGIGPECFGKMMGQVDDFLDI